MGRINSKTDRVYPVDYMFKKVDELTNLIENDLVETKEKVDNNTKYKGYQDIVTKMIQKQAVTIVCYGDSLTYGYIPGTGVQTANPYPAKLQTILRDFYKNNLITVINEGYSGRQSDEFASDTYIGYVTRNNPDLVIFLGGVNDKNGNSYGPVVPVVDFVNNLDTIHKKINKPMLFLTPSPSFGGVGTTNAVDEDKKDRIDPYVEAVKTFCNQRGVTFVDFNKGFYKYWYTRFTDIYTSMPDIGHFSDEFYQHLAEYIFAFGLSNTDIVVQEEKFYPAIHSVFNFTPNPPRYFESTVNPEYWNVLLQSNNATLSCFSYVFIDKPSADFIPVLSSGANGSNQNEIIVDGVTYPVSTYAPSTMWNVEKYLCNLKYGLHKIEFKAKTGSNGKVNLTFNGMKFVPNVLDRALPTQAFLNSKVAQSKKVIYQGLEHLQTTTGSSGWIYKEVPVTLNSKENKHYRFFMEMTGHSGLGFGKYEVKKPDGSTIKVPINVLYQGSGTPTFSISQVPLSSDTTYTEKVSAGTTLKAGTVASLSAPTFVIIDVIIDSAKMDYYVNGVLSVSVTQSDTLIGDLPLWLWVYGDNTVRNTKLFKIEELPYDVPATQFDIGDEYFDSVAKVKKIYDGTAWKTVTMA